MTDQNHSSSPAGTQPAGAAVPAPPAATAAPGRAGAPAHPAPFAPTAGPHPGARRGPKEIATLPPLAELTSEIPASPRTGEPARPALVIIAMVALLLSAAGVALVYALHWWAAAHPANYPTSARLIEWLEPDPGKWLSLTLEGALAAVAALVAGVSGAVGFHAWNGWRWTRWAGLAAVGLHGAVVALFSWWGLIGLGLALAGVVFLFLPPVSAFFRHFDAHRHHRPASYRRPDNVVYGRLPRYR